jgi:hypothetical protein
MKNLKTIICRLSIIGLLLLSSCELFQDGNGGTTTGNPGVTKLELRFDSYDQTAFLDHILNSFISKAYAQVNSASFCFKRLRFKKADDSTSDPTTNEDNIDFDIGEIVLSSSGVLLGSIELPTGEYKRLEFDLESDCSSGYSVDLNNDAGDFQTTDRITIKFRGSFTASSSNQTLSLGIQHIIDALDSHTGSQDLKDTLEDVSGSL